MATSFWRLVSQVTIWHIAASICYYAVYAGTPLFRDAFSLSGVSVGFVITALTLGYAIFLLPIGVVTDRFGEHRTLTIGLIGLAIGALLIAIAPTYGLLLGAAFVLGSMYGTATPGTNKAIFDNIQPERQHRAIGIKQIGPTIGSAISALLVTGLVGIFFWQIGFLVAAAIGFIAATLFYGESRRKPRPFRAGMNPTIPYANHCSMPRQDIPRDTIHIFK
ncbi:major facilitator superfamily transport protein (nonfunctional) (plasmid) [Natrialba magadii ATCC 43099]|uniref:Major facilitator superfamily protein n=1 Tax=Natrialba magadii (strain ATCC 43099 / DSM 3394 / CCM 3739 / CIP 104546 / IAM 13178 / JCM 8861 / NBRC 102185 / NCIMB 2190 / MS3) TaxID=547559 RepID=D3T1Q1_NATMM|nr:major facilitator superfamily transport protein (nonfunctional) [Natrialba magadii ATCC 43099]ELY26542.1 major facilitator superfamily protein [Natrialba magadii ATCC 43099]